MKKMSMKLFLAFSLIASLFTFSMQPVDASQEYKITYSPGSKGTFKESLITNYQANYGADKVVVSTATGSVTISVPKEGAMPDAPTANDINVEDNYLVATGWEPTNRVVTKSESFVVRYNISSDAVEYTIRFVDDTTGAEIASPVVSKANVGETVRGSAKTVNGYTFDESNKTMTVTSDSSANVLTFIYTGGIDRNVVTNTIVENVVNEIAGTTTTIVEALTTPTADGTVTLPDADVEEVDPDDTPLSDGTDGDNNAADSEEVNDNETPLSEGTPSTMNYLPYVGGGLLIIVVVAGAIFYLTKNKVKES